MQIFPFVQASLQGWSFFEDTNCLYRVYDLIYQLAESNPLPPSVVTVVSESAISQGSICGLCLFHAWRGPCTDLVLYITNKKCIP